MVFPSSSNSSSAMPPTSWPAFRDASIWFCTRPMPLSVYGIFGLVINRFTTRTCISFFNQSRKRMMSAHSPATTLPFMVMFLLPTVMK